jgi:hypothetical protein
MFVSRRYGLDSLICSPRRPQQQQRQPQQIRSELEAVRVIAGIFEPPHGCLAGMKQFAPLQ